jgi:hypothetical protein
MNRDRIDKGFKFFLECLLFDDGLFGLLERVMRHPAQVAFPPILHVHPVERTTGL